MVVIKKVGTKDEMEQVYGIRREVFIEEQGVPEDIEMDGRDDEAVHVLAVVDGEPAGCGRLLFGDSEARIGRVAVRKKMRRCGIGEGICKLLIALAKDKGAERIVLDAQLTAEKFYSHLGFEREGDVFMEAGMEHVRMTMKI
ncbi:MAG TPA: GNAT family N-acetyltransferase [Clostridiales bacterium]|nr:GNAT family N-acetyltransferase [Clostridiales bacterium]